LTQQIIASLLMTVMVFTFVLLLGNALNDLLRLLVNGQVSFGLAAEAVGLLIPFVWVFALPMGMLTATLLIFGRFSADQELTAVRASGVSLLALVSPVLLLSLVLCAVSALVNMEVGPRCRIAYTRLRDRLGVELTTAHLPEGRFITDFPNYIFYVGKNDQGNLKDVLVFSLNNETNWEQTVRADRGKLVVDAVNKRLNVTLFDARLISETRKAVGTFDTLPIELDLDPPKKNAYKPKIDDMTFFQLWDELRDVQRRLNLPMSLKDLTPEQRAAKIREWHDRRNEFITPIMFHIHRQVAFSFACFGFTLLGIPLGIRVHRRETNIGIAIALVLVAIYYSFILIGSALNTKPQYLPHLIVWVPNFLFQAIGAVLLWRANKGV
jgi:lipopolysaccharide export system permease protein